MFMFAVPTRSLLMTRLSTPQTGKVRHDVRITMLNAHRNNEDTANVSTEPPNAGQHSMNRRQTLLSLATAATLVPLALSNPSPTAAAKTTTDSSVKSLEDLSLGDGHWTQARSTNISTENMIVPPTFATYAARFLIQYDTAVSSWWLDKTISFSLLPNDQKQSKLGQSFGSLSMSVQLAMNQFVQQNGKNNIKRQYEELAKLFLERYGKDTETQRQIALLFATLPPSDQPTAVLERLALTTIDRSERDDALPPPRLLTDDLSALLPFKYQCVRVKGTNSFAIHPSISLYEVGIDQEFGQTATATAFGPLASTPLKRDLPEYTPDIYALFGLCGATGCALTHTIVIPLDVVKTRAQTDPDVSGGLLNGAASIIDKEGINGLLLGAQATLAGYFWYGLSVYPSYTFFKRLFGLTLLPPEIATIHANDVALVAGALAAVIASLGLTPLEACRIRTVAEPEIYRPLGLVGTANMISKEDPSMGWKTLYAGFPSLLTRQVIFGSIKFLAFEQACEAIFKLWPVLQDATWTSLSVSLVAGGISGALSSVVSQPADSVLTYVAQNSSDNLGVIEGCRIMVEKEGPASLFRGLSSRCIWAAGIIAGQFLLYDVFRTYFGVSGEDLSQIFQVSITSQ